MNRKIRYLLLFVLLMVILTGCKDSYTQIRWETESEAEITESETHQTENCETDGSLTEKYSESETHHMIYIDICGAVQKPGVYSLQEGARVFEAVELAGGLNRDADNTLINQAEVLTDGSKIYIYTKQEAEALPVEKIPAVQKTEDEHDASDHRLVDINTADVQELMSLSGIGESRAEDIISYREEQGRFTVIEEIMNVSGIKESTFNKIKDKIVVN